MIGEIDKLSVKSAIFQSPLDVSERMIGRPTSSSDIKSSSLLIVNKRTIQLEEFEIDKSVLLEKWVPKMQ